MNCLLAFLLLLVSFATPLTATLNPYTYIESVAVLQSAGRNVCTVTAINEEADSFLTAAHCVGGETLTVDGLAAYVAEVDHVNDMAILTVEGSQRKALKLATRDVQYLDHLYTAGYSWGWTIAAAYVGVVSVPSMMMSVNGELPRLVMIMQIPAAPGQSGSSVVTENYEIIGVVQSGWTPGYDSVIIGPAYTELVRFAGPYFTQ